MGVFGVYNGVFRPKIGLIGKSSFLQFKLLPGFMNLSACSANSRPGFGLVNKRFTSKRNTFAPLRLSGSGPLRILAKTVLDGGGKNTDSFNSIHSIGSMHEGSLCRVELTFVETG
jgi:hypothetical protein